MKPLFRWAGSKTRLAEHLARRLPKTIAHYCEPFCGSAALYFHLANELNGASRALNDINRILALSLGALPDFGDAQWTELAHHFETMQQQHSKRAYAKHAATMNAWLAAPSTPPPPVWSTATFLYLLGTNYNGLWRVNRSGHYNVPYGRPRFSPDVDALRSGSAELARCKITHGSWLLAVRDLPADSLVYIDPPYFGTHSAYDLAGFSLIDHATLATFVRRAEAHCMVSLPDSWVTRDLYRGLRFEKVNVQRSISSKASTRGDAAELIIRNY